jgi:hypothetical protein
MREVYLIGIGQTTVSGYHFAIVSLGKRWEKKGAGRERCHTEVGAPAKQDSGSLVVRNMSRRPRTKTSTLVCGLVVTALCRVYRRTPESTRGE